MYIQWNTQIATFPCEFDFEHVLKLEPNFVGYNVARNMISYAVEKKVVLFRTSSPKRVGISNSTRSSMAGMPAVDPGVLSLRSTIPLDLIAV